MTASRVPIGVLLILLAVVVGCGKRGNPLPPLLRVPSAPADFAAARIDNDVHVQFTVPVVNADNVKPADIARVELYALTATTEPVFDEFDDLREVATLVGTQLVRRPLPPLPPAPEGTPPVPAPPPAPGVDQGAVVVMREAITAGTRTHTVARAKSPDSQVEPSAEVPGPLVETGQEALRRFYVAVGVSPRGRYGPPTPVVPVPLGVTSTAPAAPEIVVDETSVTVRWKAPADARGGAEPTPEGLLPSRPIAPAAPPTTYDVYEVAKDAPPADAPSAVPVPLTPAPVAALEFTQSDITLGRERCFIVRPVDILGGIHVRGPASPVACASFADTFPPAPPGTLDAVATADGISLIWEPSPATDLAGYIVLRGEGADATLNPLQSEPIAGTAHTDATALPDVLYRYAVIAVDKSGNRSGESNRVEETRRQQR